MIKKILKKKNLGTFLCPLNRGQMDDKKVPKNIDKYFCNICDYLTCRKSQLDRHVLTRKHENMYNGLQMDDKKVPKSSDNFFCDCGKKYKYRQGLWKHVQKCKQKIQEYNMEESKMDIFKNLVMDVIKQNQDVIKQNQDVIKQNQELTNKIVDICKNNVNASTNIINSNINSNNKTFNLNLFLNETCKDAMNIMDFVDSIKLQLNDLIKVGEIGYVEGISNIITTNLKALDITQRPVHCTDKKREILYIKDENKWEKDQDQNKLRKVIQKIASKNQRILSQFKEKYPDCNTSASKFSDQYNKIIIEAMGGYGNNDLEKEDKIIKKITKEVILNKLEN